MPNPLRFLVADCEAPDDRDVRRQSVGNSSGESYCATLKRLAPEAVCQRVTPADGNGRPDRQAIAAFDAVFLSGASLHVYEDTPETGRLLAFMREVYASGTPAFGSCAGLQIAATAAGGRVRPNRNGAEGPIAHRIGLTAAGRSHPLFAGRPDVFDALAIHSDEVESLPAGGTCLAGNAVTAIQAAEIRHGGGVFWGVQYHPELPAAELAGSVRRQRDALVAEGAASSPAALEALADAVARLDETGPDPELAIPADRTLEIRNFIAALVEPTRSARGRN